MKQVKKPLPQPQKGHIKQSAFDRMEQFCINQQTLIIIGSCLLSLIFALLLFNPDVSVGGDDSEYILGSYNFVNGTSFPSWQGPLYPIFMAPCVAIFGVNLILLKMLSVFCWVASVFFTYKLLVRVSNHTVATIVSYISSISLLLNNYASTTYSEPFFMLLQAMFLAYLIRLIQKDSNLTTFNDGCNKVFVLKKLLPQTLLLAALSYALYQTRSVAIVAIPFTILVLILERKFLCSSMYIGWTAIIHIANSLYRSLVWNTASVSFNGQLSKAFLKNFYNVSDGYEDFMGLVQRFMDNSQLYLSKHLAKMTGFLPFNTNQISASLTVFIYLIVIASFIILWKKHKNANYIFIYASFMIGATFILLQKTWDQERLIMIYFPIVLGFVLFALYHLLNRNSLRKHQFILFMLSIVIFIAALAQTLSYLTNNYQIKHRFNSGNYESYTQDWQNYMLASKWAAQNLPDTATVICRKSQMSWIASGGKNIFKGVSRVPTTNPDTLIMNLKKMGATHVIMGNLRLNPNMKTDRTINTIRNTLFYITTKQPAAFKLVKSFGNDEQAFIFEVHLDENPDHETIMNNLDAALIINPRNINICLTKANYYYSREEFEKGLSYIDFAIKVAPKEPSLYFAQGIGFFQLGKWEKANQSFDSYISINANNAETWYNKAITLLNMNRIAEAKSALTEAKRLGFSNTTELEIALNSL